MSNKLKLLQVGLFTHLDVDSESGLEPWIRFPKKQKPGWMVKGQSLMRQQALAFWKRIFRL